MAQHFPSKLTDMRKKGLLSKVETRKRIENKRKTDDVWIISSEILLPNCRVTYFLLRFGLSTFDSLLYAFLLVLLLSQKFLLSKAKSPLLIFCLERNKKNYQVTS